uniref:glutathione-specific gamma-glutamylcyclotransferase n=1 Tax=Aegilops tauschii subsp. strangulata TaxID=200361 RepID=A0A453C2V5_AEGTS
VFQLSSRPREGRCPIREAAEAPTRTADSIHIRFHRTGVSEGEVDGGGGMVMWVFGYGSLVWNPGFAYDARLVGFVRDYRRVFYQGSTDHRGTPEFPGRTVTLEHQPGSTCWGVAYKISREQDKQTALEYLEVREKQYDEKVYLDLYTGFFPQNTRSPRYDGIFSHHK